MPIRISIRLLIPTGTLSLTERKDFLNENRYKNTVELNEHLTDMVKTYVVIPPKTEIKLKVIIEI